MHRHESLILLNKAMRDEFVAFFNALLHITCCTPPGNVSMFIARETVYKIPNL